MTVLAILRRAYYRDRRSSMVDFLCFSLSLTLFSGLCSSRDSGIGTLIVR